VTNTECDVAVRADIPAIEAVFLSERDDWSNPKSKGIGELAICGRRLHRQRVL
jgi:CO/xanthine dehydrogenase Mo-binding subunit